MRTDSQGSTVDEVLQHVELELYRDDIAEALRLLEQAQAASPHERYAARARDVRSWLRHLDDGGQYTGAYEEFYYERRGRFSLKRFERLIRIALGRKTTRTVARVAAHPEFRLLEDLATAGRVTRVLDAGCGDGRVAITLGHRHRDMRITAIDVSRTNVSVARSVNRADNVTFVEGLVEDVLGRTAPASFDLAYSFAVMEHVPDLDRFVDRIMHALRPGGRFCFVVPMNGLIATGPLPPFQPVGGVLGHVRRFTEPGLQASYGGEPEFTVVKVPGRWRPERYPATISPVEFGSFFVSFAKRA